MLTDNNRLFADGYEKCSTFSSSTGETGANGAEGAFLTQKGNSDAQPLLHLCTREVQVCAVNLLILLRWTAIYD